MKLSIKQINKDLAGTGFQIKKNKNKKLKATILNEEGEFIRHAHNVTRALVEIGCMLEEDNAKDLYVPNQA